MATWETPQEFAQELALDWGMTTETRDDIAGRVEIFATDHSNLLRADRDRAYERISLLQDQNKALFDDLNLRTELLDLARLIAKDYQDAADWKDARGKLFSMARAALDKAGISDED